MASWFLFVILSAIPNFYQLKRFETDFLNRKLLEILKSVIVKIFLKCCVKRPVFIHVKSVFKVFKIPNSIPISKAILPSD